MKDIRIEYIVYNTDGDEKIITTDKSWAMYKAKQIEGGYVRKRITTIEELEPLDECGYIWG